MLIAPSAECLPAWPIAAGTGFASIGVLAGVLLSGIFFASVDRFTRAFQAEDAKQRVIIDVRNAHFWNISGVGALDKIVARMCRDGGVVEVVGYNRAGASLIDRFALHDRTGVEMGLAPH